MIHACVSICQIEQRFFYLKRLKMAQNGITGSPKKLKRLLVHAWWPLPFRKTSLSSCEGFLDMVKHVYYHCRHGLTSPIIPFWLGSPSGWVFVFIGASIKAAIMSRKDISFRNSSSFRREIGRGTTWPGEFERNAGKKGILLKRGGSPHRTVPT